MLEKKTIVGQILIRPMGQVEIKEYTELWEDGVLTHTFTEKHGTCINPDEVYEGDDEEVKKIIAVAHRPEKKAAYIQWKQELDANEEKRQRRERGSSAEGASDAPLLSG